MSSATLEMRWFFRDRPEWFDRPMTDSRSDFSVRTDWYAPISVATSSVKLRGATETRRGDEQPTADETCAVESKILQGKCSRNIGIQRPLVVEHWVKHTLRKLEASSEEDMELRRLVAQQWLEVRKERLLCWTKNSIQIEFAIIELRREKFWTYCIESPDDLRADGMVNWLRDSGHPWVPPISVLCEHPQESWPSWLREWVID